MSAWSEAVETLKNSDTGNAFRRWRQRRSKSTIRKLARIGIALVFWAHALSLKNLIPAHDLVHIRYGGLGEPDLVILAVILFYSLLGASGWLSLLFDLGWIYLFPLIIGLRIALILAKLTFRLIKQFFFGEGNSGDPAKKTREVENQIANLNAQPQKAGKPKLELNVWSKISEFATLWGALVVLSHDHILIFIGVAITLLAAIRGVYIFRVVLHLALKWLDAFQRHNVEAIAKLLDSIRDADLDSNMESAVKATDGLKPFEKLFKLTNNKSLLKRLVNALSLILSLPYYIYISILLSFTYYGIAHLYGSVWPWRQALIDSLFVPFAFTDIPHIFLVQILAGLQAFGLAYLGYNAISGRIAAKVEDLSCALGVVQERLRGGELSEKILIVRMRTEAQTNSGASPK